jgi:hypothetical protein
MQSDFQVPLLVLVFLYMFHTTGELFLSPIGLSMVTKLSPKHMAGTAMGGWFLSFAIANLLGGQIAALTGDGHGGSKADKDKFTVESTVRDAIGMMKSDAISFEDWQPLKEGDAKNITYGRYLDVQDWVEYREKEGSASFDDWKMTRTINDTLTDASQWLNAEAWASLGKRYATLTEADKAADEDENEATESGLDMDSWKYFRSGFGTLDAAGASLKDAFEQQKKVVLEKGLNKYVGVFSTIGYVLIGIAVLIALLSKPLNKLMHGVS